MAAPMKMRQSLSQFEAAFREEQIEERERREALRNAAATRSRVRRAEKTTRNGTFRFIVLAVTMIATAVIVTIAMFQTLALLLAT